MSEEIDFAAVQWHRRLAPARRAAALLSVIGPLFVLAAMTCVGASLVDWHWQPGHFRVAAPEPSAAPVVAWATPEKSEPRPTANQRFALRGALLAAIGAGLWGLAPWVRRGTTAGVVTGLAATGVAMVLVGLNLGQALLRLWPSRAGMAGVVAVNLPPLALLGVVAGLLVAASVRGPFRRR